MKTKMWFLSAMFLIISIFTISYIGCKETATNEPLKEEKPANPYYKVGQLHNSAFVYTLNCLEMDKNNNWRPKKEADLKDKIFYHLNEFNQEMNLNNEMNAGLYSIISDRNESNKLLKSTIFDNVTPEQQYYLDKIDNLIYEIPELEELRKELSNLDAEVIYSLNEIEAAPILNKSAVALASKTYWSENFESWVKTVTDTNHLNKSTLLLPEGIFERLAYADAAGAAAGALYAIVSGQLYAITGMAATGAAYGTAIEAIVILYEILSEL